MLFTFQIHAVTDLHTRYTVTISNNNVGLGNQPTIEGVNFVNHILTGKGFQQFPHNLMNLKPS